MTDPDSIERSATGMLRNFGPEAAAMAQDLSRKFTRQDDPAAAQLWAAIARSIGRLATAPRA